MALRRGKPKLSVAVKAPVVGVQCLHA